MSAAPHKSLQEIETGGVEGDLSSIALYAAAEIDNLILRRHTDTVAIERLIAAIADSLTEVPNPSAPDSLLNPTTAVVLNRAIGEYAGKDEPPTELDELLAQATEVMRQMKKLVSNAGTFILEHSDEANRLRSFCVALSKHALAARRAVLERQPHPFRT